MELPPPGQEPSAEWMAEFKALPLKERLDLTVQLAARLGEIVSRTFPDAAAHVARTYPVTVDANKPRDVEAMLAQGDAASAELFNVAMRLAPEKTLDDLDRRLDTDTASASQTQMLMRRLKNEGNSQ